MGENVVHIGFDEAFAEQLFVRTYGDEPVEITANGAAADLGREGAAGRLTLRYGDETPARLTYWTLNFPEAMPIVPQLEEIGFWVKTNVPVSIKIPISPFGFIYHGPAVQPSDEWQQLSVGNLYEVLKAWCENGNQNADFGTLPGVILAVNAAPGMAADILVDDVALVGQEGVGAFLAEESKRRRFGRVIASVVTLPWSDEGRTLEFFQAEDGIRDKAT